MTEGCHEKGRCKMKVLDKITGIDRYEHEIDVLQEKNETLATRVAHLQNMCEELRKELDFYKATDEERIQILRDDISELEELYKKRISECEAMTDEADGKIHSAYAKGRQDAYFDMGIKNIEAHERGNILVRTPDGDVVEMILDLEDVKADIEEAKAEVDSCLENEITIDDLAEV